MAIAFYCEDDDPKVLHGSQSYYAAYGYNSYQQQQAAVVEHHPQQSQQQAGGAASAVVDGNNNNSNCALHGSGTINTEGGSNSDASVADATATSSKQALMQVLHQVLYRYTMEGALSPAHTSCVFCNKIYYLFQLLY